MTEIDLRSASGLEDEALACQLSRLFTIPDAALFETLARIASLPERRYNAVLDTAERYAEIYRTRIEQRT